MGAPEVFVLVCYLCTSHIRAFARHPRWRMCRVSFACGFFYMPVSLIMRRVHIVLLKLVACHTHRLLLQVDAVVCAHHSDHM